MGFLSFLFFGHQKHPIEWLREAQTRISKLVRIHRRFLTMHEALVPLVSKNEVVAPKWRTQNTSLKLFWNCSKFCHLGAEHQAPKWLFARTLSKAPKSVLHLNYFLPEHPCSYKHQNGIFPEHFAKHLNLFCT